MSKILMISNMYPSKRDKYYGIFVKKNITIIQTYASVDKVVISGKTKNNFVKLIRYFGFYFKITFRLIFYKYDIVYVHFFTYSSLPLLLCLPFRPNIKIVLNAHGGDVLPISKFAGKLISLSQKLVSKASLIIVPSKFFKEKFVDVYKGVDSEIFISPSSGVDKFFFNYNHDPKERYTIGYVSRIDYGKGWDVFLRAIKELKDKNEITFKAIVVGGGAESNECVKCIEENDLCDVVEFLGEKSQEELPAIYEKFDVFIFPTLLMESLGLVAIEAMANKVPVIASKIGGIIDYLKDGENGFFFDPGSNRDLVSKIEKYYYLSMNEKATMQNNAINTALNYETDIINGLLIEKLLTI